uniref:Uncharacterized protein n=1 Tax=Rhizophora mucronata TaxID=61149 RepID=A0A2P2N778_RHIMU
MYQDVPVSLKVYKALRKYA